MPKTKTNKLKQKFRKYTGTHNKFGQCLSYQDKDRNLYTRETHKDTEWKVYKRTNK